MRGLVVAMMCVSWLDGTLAADPEVVPPPDLKDMLLAASASLAPFMAVARAADAGQPTFEPCVHLVNLVPVPSVQISFGDEWTIVFERSTRRLLLATTRAMRDMKSESKDHQMTVAQAEARMQQIIAAVLPGRPELGAFMVVPMATGGYCGGRNFVHAGTEYWGADIGLTIDGRGRCLAIRVNYLPSCLEPVNKVVLSAEQALAAAQRNWVRDQKGITLKRAELRLTVCSAEVRISKTKLLRRVPYWVWTTWFQSDEPEQKRLGPFNCLIDAESGEFLGVE